MNLKSIRSRILVGVGLVQLAAAAVAVSLVIQQSRRESVAAFDASLTGHANSLLALIPAPEDNRGALVPNGDLLALPNGDRYRVLNSQDQVIAETPGWQIPAHLPVARRAYLNLSSQGVSYRVLLLRDTPLLDTDEEERSASARVTLLYGAPTNQMDAHLGTIAASVVLASVVMLIFNLLATSWIVRAGLRPLTALANEAASIHRGKWDFIVPASATGIKEVAPLSAALSLSLARLKAAFERERQMFGDAAHELKTAVAIVKSTLQLALQTTRSAGEYRQRIVRALDDTDRMEALVIRMLQLAAIETIVNLSYAPTNIYSALASLDDRFATLAQARGIRVQVSLPETLHWVDIPEQDFVMLAANLIENALQHSHSGQIVEVACQERRGFSEFSIRDYGHGIPEAAIPHLFERFFRTDQSRSRSSGGVGLGLAIVHALVVRYNGTVEVETALSEGCTFTVRLPVASPSDLRHNSTTVERNETGKIYDRS
jgi:signal transduction histidine kinase